MNFGTNKTPIEIINEGAFGGTYCRNIYSGVNNRWHQDTWKEIDELKNIGQKYYSSDFYDISLNKYGVKCDTSLRYWENNGWINKTDPYEWLQWHFRYWFGGRSKDDKRQRKRWNKIVNRFKGKLIEMI